MDFRKQFQVKPGKKVKLKKIDPDFAGKFEDKDKILERIKFNTERLIKLQYRLYAENKRSLLIVLQAMDAGGKDGVINHVFAVMNPQGCRAQSFKKPAGEELGRDFLWRIHRQAPKNGEVVIFNRSHYEDVLTVRVHDMVPKDVWKERYDMINNFEAMLAANNTTIVKIYLHISKEEQLKRFIDRLNDPEKHWKISDADYTEREHWNDYMTAFEDVFARCSTKNAPWYIIPSNKKYFRDLAISEILADTLEDMKLTIPAPTVDIAKIRQLAEEAMNK